MLGLGLLVTYHYSISSNLHCGVWSQGHWLVGLVGCGNELRLNVEVDLGGRGPVDLQPCVDPAGQPC